MDMQRRTLVSWLAAISGAGADAGPTAQAQPVFPWRPIRMVVPHAAGGGADMTVRTLAQSIAGPLGQSVVVENRPGAGGVVAGEIVARAEPDGHTLLLVSSGTAVSAALFKSMPFDVLRDFAPVSLLARFDLVLAVRAGARFATLAGLLDWARAHPGRLNMGTPQIGSTQHLAAELFKASAAIAAQVVPFNGTPQLMAALRGGEIDLLLDILGPLLPQFAAGALQPLAVLGAQRAAQLPAVPTVAESGAPLTGFDLSSWNGLAAPVHTPPAVIERLAHEVQAALARPDVRQRLLDLNLSPRSSSPEQLADQLAADVRRWRELIARAGIARL